MKKICIIMALLMGLMSLGACTSKPVSKNETNTNQETKDTEETKNDTQKTEETKTEEKSQEDVVAKSRIVNLSPPIYSMLCAMDLAEKVVGTTPMSINGANKALLEKIHPGFSSVETGFMNADHKVNRESLLNLQPDIVLYYGKFQDDGITELQIPAENMAYKALDPEAITIFWEDKLAQILGVENTHKMEHAWKKTHERIDPLKYDGTTKALYIFSNMKGLFVSGKNSYGDAFLQMIGLHNVAGETDGFKEGAGQVKVSMEQINQWNPDVIFVGVGASAKDMLENKVPNQNWENISAVKNGKVFDIPKGVFPWHVPNSDSPLMPLWMLHSLDDSKIGADEFHQWMMDFYKEMYDITLDEALMETILHPKSMK
ncbi:MAG: ABC transporter substrate-binding protein [Tissierellia bacterium]|nr:ABC transporter substrate-binding protein [Tissierellia bacterium]